MNIRDLIEQLQDIARRSGDLADIVVCVEIDDEDFGYEQRDVVDAVYTGGGIVELRT